MGCAEGGVKMGDLVWKGAVGWGGSWSIRWRGEKALAGRVRGNPRRVRASWEVGANGRRGIGANLSRSGVAGVDEGLSLAFD